MRRLRQHKLEILDVDRSWAEHVCLGSSLLRRLLDLYSRLFEMFVDRPRDQGNIGRSLGLGIGVIPILLNRTLQGNCLPDAHPIKPMISGV
jgi:hypothetical protein